MKVRETVERLGDIPDAIDRIERAVRPSPHFRRDWATLSTICSELLSHLVKCGYSPVSLVVRESRGLVADISARGEVDRLEPRRPDDDLERIEEEINLGILNAYGDYIDFQYRQGVNRYRVVTGRKRADSPHELADEIYGHCSQVGPEASEKPLSVLRYLFRRHRLMFTASFANKTVKHLAALTLPYFASCIIDLIATAHSVLDAPVLMNILASIIALAVNLVCAWMDNRIYHRFTRSIEAGFKMALVQKLQVLSMNFHSDTPDGKLLSKLVSDVQFIGQLIYENATDILHLCIDIVFVCVMTLLRMPVMLLFYMVAVPLAAGAIRSFLIPIKTSKVTLRKKTEHSNAAFKEMLEMVTVTRSHGLQKTEYDTISKRVYDVRSEAIRYDRFQNRLNNMGYGSFQGCRIVCLVLASYLAIEGHITIGSVVLFLSLFDAIVNSTQRVLDSMPQIVQGYDSLASVGEILGARDVERDGDQVLPEPVRGEVVFDDVVFGYDGEGRPVIDGLSLRIPADTSVAFIGESGSGKSTLLNLVLGLYSPQGGRVLVDGVDVDDLDRASYRSHIAVVPQVTALFAGTLWDNLVYGMRYPTTAQVMEALKGVGLDDLVDGHPDGLQMPVLEGGRNLSGGQRQRIAIARALLRKPRIILFDEATSALDVASEKQVQQAIESIMGTCTVIMVAHRLTTLDKADYIYRIEDGKATLVESLEAEMG